MSSWGNTDNVVLTGTVTTANTTNTVTGFGTTYTGNVNAGDYVFIDSNKYQVEQVVSASVLYVTTSNVATNSDNVNAYVQAGPKYVTNIAISSSVTGNAFNRTENVTNIQSIYGIDREEVDVPENKDRGIGHTGWTSYITYTDALGQTRHRAETIVAMSKNFASNATGSLFATGAGVDASDDTVAADYLIYFIEQPEDVTDYIANLSSATFQVAATSEPTGATITYQWYENNTTHIVALAAAGVYSDVTTNTLAISNVSGLDGYSYFVIISGDGGADSNTSGNATITIL